MLVKVIIVLFFERINNKVYVLQKQLEAFQWDLDIIKKNMFPAFVHWKVAIDFTLFGIDPG